MACLELKAAFLSRWNSFQIIPRAAHVLRVLADAASASPSEGRLVGSQLLWK